MGDSAPINGAWAAGRAEKPSHSLVTFAFSSRVHCLGIFRTSYSKSISTQKTLSARPIAAWIKDKEGLVILSCSFQLKHCKSTYSHKIAVPDSLPTGRHWLSHAPSLGRSCPFPEPSAGKAREARIHGDQGFVSGAREHSQPPTQRGQHLRKIVGSQSSSPLTHVSLCPQVICRLLTTWGKDCFL